jgi:hypothetical protein
MSRLCPLRWPFGPVRIPLTIGPAAAIPLDSVPDDRIMEDRCIEHERWHLDVCRIDSKLIGLAEIEKLLASATPARPVAA